MEKKIKNDKKNSLLGKGLSLSVLTLLSRIMGLIREVTKARFLGTSAFSDAFGVAFQIPNLCRKLFAENSVSVAFIPTFKNYLEDSTTAEGKKETQNFVNATFTLVTFLTTVFVALGMIFTPFILKLFYADADIESMKEAIVLTRIMFPYLILISIAAFFQGILNGIKIFSPSGATPIFFNGIVVLTTYLLSGRTANPARAMAIGVTAGGCVQALFQLPFVLKNNWSVTFTSLRNAFTNPGTRKVISLVIPTILGMACYQLNDLVSSILAVRAGEGIVSSLSYSLRLQELILGIFAVSIGTVILPDLSGFAKHEDWGEFSKLLSQSVKLIVMIAVPVSFYSIIMGENLITLIFSTGKFNEESVKLTNSVFFWHITGLPFIAANRILPPAFYAQSNTKLPTLAGIINFAVNIIMAFVLVNWGPFSATTMLKGQGIALSLSAASAVNTILLFVFLKKTKASDIGAIVKPVLLYSVKIIILSAIASVPVFLLRGKLIELFAGRHRFLSQGVPVAVTALIFLVLGVAGLIVTKDPLISVVIKKIKRQK